MCGITVVVRMWGDMLMESPDTSAMSVSPWVMRVWGAGRNEQKQRVEPKEVNPRTCVNHWNQRTKPREHFLSSLLPPCCRRSGRAKQMCHPVGSETSYTNCFGRLSSGCGDASTPERRRSTNE
ncbi:hypothetical protein IG631_09691 [Alternaria alternata]|nr:hypothetical protein IG631_09691 [Alternaria alternata]